jgi:hypothetical protein
LDGSFNLLLQKQMRLPVSSQRAQKKENDSSFVTISSIVKQIDPPWEVP